MLKFLRTFAMAAAMMLPFAMQAQNLNESFDGTAWPPDEWTATNVSGTVSWARYTSNTRNSSAACASANYASNGHENYLITPQLAPVDGDTLTFYVSAQSYGGTTLTIEVSTATNATSDFTTTLATYTTGSSGTLGTTSLSTYVEKKVDLSAYDGQQIYVAFHVVDDDGSRINLEDVSGPAIVLPSCFKVTDLAIDATQTTSSSLTLTWTDTRNSGGASYDVYTITPSDTTFLGNATDTFYTATGLDANTSYVFGVATNCGGGEVTEMAIVNGRTSCAAYDLPYTENFSATLASDPCWRGATGTTADEVLAGTALTLTANNQWTYASSTSNGLEAGHYRVNIYGTSCKKWMITPEIDLTTASNPLLTFGAAFTVYSSSSSSPATGFENNATQKFMVLVSTNNGQTWAVASDIALTSIASSSYVPQYVSLAPYAGETVRIAFYAQSTAEGGDNNLHIDNINVEESTGDICFPVSGLMLDATQTTSSSLTLTWTSDATSFVIVNMADGSQVGTSGTNSYTVEDLDANTSYTFGVVVDCGGETSDTIIVSGRTACAAIATLPYNMGFEESDLQGTTNADLFPFCWTRINTLASGTYTYYPYAYNYGTPHDGSRHLYFSASSYGSYADTTGFIMPALDVTTYPMNGNRVIFWAKASSSSYPFTVRVGTMTNPADRSTFTLVESVSVTATSYTKYAVSLATAAATDAYVAFIVPKVNSTMYIDDVTLEELPSCGDITGVAVASATAESITLSWNTVEGANGYTVYNMSDSSVLGTTPDTTYEVTGLDANTVYNFGVQSNCTGGDGALATVSGRTSCVAYDLPFTENFSATLANDPCWRGATGTTADEVLAGTALTLTANNQWTYENSTSNGLEAGHYRVNIWGTGCKKWMITPEIDLTTASNPLLTFDAAFTVFTSSSSSPATGFESNASQKFMVLVSTNNGQTWAVASDIALTSIASSSYVPQYVSLASYAGETVRIAFYAQSTTSGGDNNLHIDNINIEESTGDICFPVSGLTVDATQTTSESITLSWVSDGSSFVVLNMADTTVAATVSDTTATIENLTASTSYTFGVVNDCGSETSDTVLITVRTACGAIALPYTEDFSATLANDPCWRGATGTTADEVLAGTALTLTANNQWTYENSTSNGLEAGHYRVNIFGTSCKKWMITPEIDLTTASNPLLTFGAAFTVYTSSSSSPATGFESNASQKFMVLVSTNNGQTWAVASDIALTSIASSSYVPQYVSLASYAGETVRIAFYAQSTVTGGDNNLHIDNINIEESTGDICFPVSGLTVDATQTTTESITLSWVSDGSSFVVLNMADTTVAATVSDTTATIENLTASTSYTFGVVNDCGSETSDTVLITVRTACGAIALPYTEDFESGIDCWSMVSCATNTNVQSTYPYTGTKSFKFAFNSNPPQYLISPELEGGEDGVQVSFMYRVNGSSYPESFVLGYSTTTNEVSAFTWLTEQTGLTNETYEAYTDYMPAGTKYVAVKYTANDMWGLYIDSMVFSPVDAGFCFPVTGLTVDTASANEVTISWSGDAANYSIYNGTTYVGSTADTFYTVNGLTASTGYTFGVTSVCSATDSADMVTVSARTDCEGGSCNITIASAGYGLVGASIDVMQNGSLVANVTDESYAPFSTAVSVCANVPVTLVYHQTPYASYDYDEYVSFTVSDGAGTVLYTCAQGNGVALTEGQTLLTIANACPTCLPVTDLAVDTVETTSVTISWSGTAASYNVYNGTTYVATVSTNSYTFTGLSAAMNYTFGVVALCDDEDSSAMATIVASTECGIISTFPYTQSFDAAPACWATIDADGDGYNWENLQGAMHSASYDNSVGILTPDNWLITPQFQLGAGNSYEVTWNANPQDASYPAEHYGLYVSTNSTIDTANFTILQEWTLTSAGNTPVVDLSAYSGQTIYLALRHWNCSDQYRIAIDNFELREQAGANQVTITLSQNNPMYGSVAGGGVYTIGDNVTVTATPSAGYQFSKWINSASVTVSTDNPYTFVASTDTALQAVFVSAAATTYDVVVTVNDSTMGTATGSGTYTSGDVVVMTATANPGYHFVNWTQNNTVLSTNNPFSMSATSNTAAYPIIANFEADMVETPTYTVTVNVNDATMGHVDGVPTAAVDSGAVVNLTAVPESGYHFVSWSNGLTTAAISLIVTSDTTVTATFEANPANTYTVAVSVNDAAMGHVDGIPTEPVTAGTVVNLTAVADAGYHFVDWSNGLTTAAISITVTSDTTLVANFEADPVEPTYYTVTVVYDATMGTVDGIPTEPVTSDDDITLTARANEGYVFKGWVIGTDTMSTEATYTFHATDDVTIEAVFAAKTGIADVDMANVKVYSVNDVIYVNGAEGHQVYLFDVNGRVLNHSAKAGEHVEFRVANTGVYLVKVGNAAAKRVVVAR